MENLTVSLVQGATRWRDPAANRAYYGDLMQRIDRPTDLIVLPETFTGGFGRNARDRIETMQGATIEWLQAQAASHHAAITGSVQLRAQGSQGEAVYNRMLFVMPDGTIRYYDKRHLFRYANEHHRYASGSERLLLNWRGWNILPQVCYDLRFPVWNRNRFVDGDADYDLILFVANWPVSRRTAWRNLLQARAIENLACCVGVNRVGTDGKQLDYGGNSAVIDAAGEYLLELGAQEQVVSVTLDRQRLLAHRRDFPFWMDADAFSLHTSGN